MIEDIGEGVEKWISVQLEKRASSPSLFVGVEPRVTSTSMAAASLIIAVRPSVRRAIHLGHYNDGEWMVPSFLPTSTY